MWTQGERSKILRDMARVPHQLSIHLDYAPHGHLDDLEIRWSYPHGTYPIPEQVLRVPLEDIPQALRKDLDELVEALAARIPQPATGHLPHRDVNPVVKRGIATVVIQDARRDLPIARLYYFEELTEIGHREQRQVRMESADFRPAERETWRRVREAVKKMAWYDYESRFQ